MAIWTLNVELILDSNMTRKEMKNFLQNASMNDIMDMIVQDMSISQKQLDSIRRHREKVDE